MSYVVCVDVPIQLDGVVEIHRFGWCSACSCSNQTDQSCLFSAWSEFILIFSIKPAALCLVRLKKFSTTIFGSCFDFRKPLPMSYFSSV